MAFAAANRDNQMSDMNITPLVDVMLVLLVIFMLAAPALSRVQSLTLPHHGEPPTIPPVEASVRVESGDVFTLDGQAMSRAQITAALEARVAVEPDLKVNLDVDPNAEYESAVQAMAAINNAGIDTIALPKE
jgi:biopolymer transport protein ExbD